MRLGIGLAVTLPRGGGAPAPVVLSCVVAADGVTYTATFDRAMTGEGNLQVYVAGDYVWSADFGSIVGSVVTFAAGDGTILSGEVVTVAYTGIGGDLASAVGGVPLAAFSGFACTNNSTQVPSGQDTITATGDGTYTPTYTGNALVECWGAGGSSQVATVAGRSSGGSGGGAYSASVVALTNGVGIPYHVGAAVAATTGEDTYFVDAATLMAKGGTRSGTNASAGAGGATAASVGTTKFAGGAGGGGAVTTGSGFNGGGGGGSGGTASGGNAGTTGSGGTGAGATAVTGGAAGGNGGAAPVGGPGVAGSNGTAPGGGSGGGGGNSGTVSAAGGLGGAGQIRITWPVSTPTLRAATSGNTNVATLPTNQSGDKLLLVGIHATNSGGALGSPAGWTLLASGSRDVGDGYTLSVAAWWKTSGGAESDPTFATGSNPSAWQCMAWSGAGTPTAGTVGQGSGANITAPSHPGSVGNVLVSVYARSSYANGVPGSITPPGGQTGTTQSSSAFYGGHVRLGYELLCSTAANARTATDSADNWIAVNTLVPGA